MLWRERLRNDCVSFETWEKREFIKSPKNAINSSSKKTWESRSFLTNDICRRLTIVITFRGTVAKTKILHHVLIIVWWNWAGAFLFSQLASHESATNAFFSTSRKRHFLRIVFRNPHMICQKSFWCAKPVCLNFTILLSFQCAKDIISYHLSQMCYKNNVWSLVDISWNCSVLWWTLW